VFDPVDLLPKPEPPSSRAATEEKCLWALFAAPLILGCELSRLDDFQMNLLTNDEVIAIDQDPLGAHARRVATDHKGGHVFAKPMADGSLAVGLFNTSAREREVNADWSDLGIRGERTIRDVCKQKDLGRCGARFRADVSPHGVVLLNLRP
jgi:alpha-galactosidase